MFTAIRRVNISRDMGKIADHMKRFNKLHVVPEELRRALSFYGIRNIYADRRAGDILSGFELAERFRSLTLGRLNVPYYLTPTPPDFRAFKIDFYQVFGHLGLQVFVSTSQRVMYVAGGERLRELISLHFRNMKYGPLKVGGSHNTADYYTDFS